MESEKNILNEDESTKMLNDDIINVKSSSCIKTDMQAVWNENYPEENFIEFTVYEGNTKINLHTYRNATCTKPKGVVIYFHGLGSYSKTSAHLAKKLAESDLITVCYDTRGMGKSEGRRMYINSFQTILQDSREFVTKIIELYPDLPLFIGGASMGGLISYKLSFESPEKFKGVFFLGPAFKINIGCFSTFMVHWLGCCFPCVKLPCRPPSIGTKSEISIERTTKDPFINNKATSFTTISAMMKSADVEPTFKHYKSNFICFMGGQEKLVDIDVAFTLVKNAKSKNKKLYFYDELYHNILSEEECGDVIEKIINWFNNLLEN